MDNTHLQVRMLGEFSISLGDHRVTDGGNRSRKVWLLLAYMIYCRKRPVTTEELSGLLWSENEGSANPLNALKTTLHRVRASLDPLYPEAGHDLIVRRQGSYAWNPDIDVVVDIDLFDALCRAGDTAADEEERLFNWLEALALYQGDFLAKLAVEPWVVPIAAYFHQLFIRVTLSAVEMLEERSRWSESAALCRRAVEHEPYDEEVYRHLMLALSEMGEQQEAAAVYEAMCELLYSNFGVMPSEETRELHRKIMQTVNDRTVSLQFILEQIREPETSAGALMCDYDFFRAIYRCLARYIERSGDAVHLGLISLTGSDGKELSRRSLDRAMENLQELIRVNLRRGDVAARCSVSQFVLLLPQANYENSQMVCRRITKSFTRQYPHSPAELHVSVLPITPYVSGQS